MAGPPVNERLYYTTIRLAPVWVAYSDKLARGFVKRSGRRPALS
jgi:hypothetical protein